MSQEQPNFEQEKAVFIHENQTDLKVFFDQVSAQFDNSTEEPENNDGRLRKPLNDSSILACKWQALLPQLPERLNSLLPFSSTEPVVIHARYRYGTMASMINIWINNIGENHKSFSLGLRTYENGELDEFMSQAGSDDTGNVSIGPIETKAVVDAIFAKNYMYQQWGARLDLLDSFLFGINSQPDFGAEKYTVEKAGKIIGAKSRSSNHYLMQQFELNLALIDREHPNQKPSQTRIELRRHFGALDFPEDEIYGGMLEHQLSLVQDPAGRIIDLSRTSKIDFANEPVSMNNGGTMILFNPAKTDIPDRLKAQLYSGPLPTLDDLDFFKRLLFQPIQPEDIFIN